MFQVNIGLENISHPFIKKCILHAASTIWSKMIKWSKKGNVYATDMFEVDLLGTKASMTCSMLYASYPPMPVRIFRFSVAIFRFSTNFIQSVLESIQLFVNDDFQSKVCQFCNVNDIIIQLLFRNEIIFGITMRINCLKYG